MWYHQKQQRINTVACTIMMKEGGVFKILTTGRVVEFKPHEKGLHHLDLKNHDTSKAIWVSTIRNNYKRFTKNQLNAAAVACRLWVIIGSHSQKDFEGMLHSNMIQNYHLTVDDVANAYNIFGPDLAETRGKTVT